MLWLRMASRVALLGNIAFAGCVLLKYVSFVQDPDLTSLLLILGWFLGTWMNLAVTGCVLIVWWRRRSVPVPSWLFWVNGGFCLVQLCYLII